MGEHQRLDKRLARFARFEPEQVARYEADLWKEYYERKPFHLFAGMVRLLQSQFGLEPLRAVYCAYLMSHAQFYFARDRLHYRQARYYLYCFFRSVQPQANPADTLPLCNAEFAWWIIHREHFGMRRRRHWCRHSNAYTGSCTGSLKIK